MRAAPAVEATLGRGTRERWLITLLHGMSGAVVVTWCLALAEVVEPLRWWAALLASTWAAGLIGARCARQLLPDTPQGLLWDGQRWVLRDLSDGATREVPLGAVVLAIDVGVWVLLRLLPASGARPVWRVASAGGAGAAWHGLRLALRAHGGVAKQMLPGAKA